MIEIIQIKKRKIKECNNSDNHKFNLNWIKHLVNYEERHTIA